ncbi:fungal-specific transcription factor domain-containing protein [Cyathus striatus]|nr:fungal-specific transcription factor domain-containing protein [Cyathus striatus]
MDWRDSDPSEDEAHNEDAQLRSRKRSSRACDQCRKTKSKCERPMGEGVQCKSCSLAGTACTFLGPSYKRGPPKGYIHAIEQRWHQVEALLGAVLQCLDPRVQTLIGDLRQDELAREILNRVDNGPYGPSGRRSQPADATKEDFFASILKSNESSGTRDSSRSRRQSRVSREIVSSSQDHGLSVVPTKQWQDNLSNRLASTSSSMNYNLYPASSTEQDISPITQKRRLDTFPAGGMSRSDLNTMYTVDAGADYQKTTEGMGELSLDEHQEVRFHGEASGLHLLGQNLRTDGRMEGGIWRLPMARVWPPTKYGLVSQPFHSISVPLPPRHLQDRMIDLYFTYIHPVFPVLHKERFLDDYRSRQETNIMTAKEPIDISSSPRPEPSQELTPLLLLSIFSLAARFSEDDMPYPDEGKMWEAGCAYFDRARDTLTKIFHASRPSTVQALLLLGFREFGIGSTEQGWIFIGMAIRMAFDLGLNCDSSRWKLHGRELFSPEERQTRSQIWWGCMVADRYGSIYMGRPTMIKDTDFDAPFPEILPIEENTPWQPYPAVDSVQYTSMPARVMSVFGAGAKLTILEGAIISKVYPVRTIPGMSRQGLLSDLESRLDQWYIALPEQLTYEPTSRRPTPPPQILILNIRYRAAVLLLYRAFIPNWTSDNETKSPISSRAFDHAQGAASYISSIATIYRETFTLQRSSPILTSYLFNAAIMHVLTLTMRPANVEASLGLQRCMSALKDMGVIWPSASRAWELLNGVQLRTDVGTLPVQGQSWERNKRYAEDAFGQEKVYQYLPRDLYGPEVKDESGVPDGGVQELSTRLMAHMLGLDIPGIEPSTSYYPGYEWWPRQDQNSSQSSSQTHSRATSISQPRAQNAVPPMEVPQTVINPPESTVQGWLPNMNPPSGINLSYSYDYGQYSRGT